jgi:hypothetical protein
MGLWAPVGRSNAGERPYRDGPPGEMKRSVGCVRPRPAKPTAALSTIRFVLAEAE